jgi:hypothetical protein
MKKCTCCRLEKTFADFYSKRQSWCIKCTQEYQSTKGRSKQLSKRYGISILDYNKMLEKQDYCCAICKTHISNLTVNLAVDHCHNSMRIRGLLCYNCNSGLGRFKDSIKLLQEAAKYLMPFND